LSSGRLDRRGNHILEQDLEGHCVAAALMGQEELAITGKNTVIELYVVVVVISVEGKVKFVEAESLPIFCISFGFFAFSDHSIVHVSVLLFGKKINKKTHGENRVSSITEPVYFL
jgi:hypothetical protein